MHNNRIRSTPKHIIVCVSQDPIEYLPTINAQATQLPAVQEILGKSLKIESHFIKNVQFLSSIRSSGGKTPKLGVLFFFLVSTKYFVNYRKRFQDAWLCIESGVIAEDSLAGLLLLLLFYFIVLLLLLSLLFRSRKYNCWLRFHNLMYEAVMKLAWRGLSDW